MITPELAELLRKLRRQHDNYSKAWSAGKTHGDRMYYMGMTIAIGTAVDQLEKVLGVTEKTGVLI